MAFMSVVSLSGLLLVQYPVMSIDPASLEGRMYYLCDSEVMDKFPVMGQASWSLCRRDECEVREEVWIWGHDRGVREEEDMYFSLFPLGKERCRRMSRMAGVYNSSAR